MKLLVTVRLASPNMRNTEYVPVVVDAKDGGDAQRKAMEIAQAEYKDRLVSGGTVCPATDLAIAAQEKQFHREALHDSKKAKRAKPNPVDVRGVRTSRVEGATDQ